MNLRTVWMIGSAIVVSAAPVAAFGQASVFRGVHLYFDTATGAAGEQLQLITGVGTTPNPGESENWAFRFQNGSAGGQLQTRAERYASNPNAAWGEAQYTLLAPAPAIMATSPGITGGAASPVSGWFSRSNLAANPVTQRQSFNPTGADLFVGAGRLTGGDFAYEIQSVTALNGSPAASFAMAPLANTGVTPESLRTLVGTYTTTDLGAARTLDCLGIFDSGLVGGGALADRSLYLGFGNHVEGWGMFVSAAGVYEVAMRVYDVNGRYAPSASFTFLVNSVPTPGAGVVMGLAALIGLRRRR